MSEPTKIETPDEMAERLYLAAVADEKPLPRSKPNAPNFMAHAIRADREQIAAWCVESAESAEGVANAASQRRGAGERAVESHALGKAEFARALAALLRGAK